MVQGVYIMRIPKGSSVSKELSKKFGRVFNTKKTFFFDIGKEDSNVNTMGNHVQEYLQDKADYINNNKGKSNGEKIG